MSKIKYSLILLVCTLLVVKLLSLKPSGAYQVSFLDVGQGDAIYLESPEGVQLLIDGGPDDSILDQLRQVMPIGDSSIDYLILSHADADHIRGLIEVIDQYRINTVIMPEFPKSSGLYKQWIQVLAEQSIPVKYIVKEEKINIDSHLQLHFLHPSPSTMYSGISANDASLVFIASISEMDFFFTGDIESKTERDIVKTYTQLDIDIEVLKSPHHGSKTSSSEELLDWSKPELVVVQSGRDNKYSHPHNRVIHRYQSRDMNILRTDQLGVIHLFFNSQQIWQGFPRIKGFPQLFGFQFQSMYTISR